VVGVGGVVLGAAVFGVAAVALRAPELAWITRRIRPTTKTNEM
jgi:hypothetical protein